MTEKQTNYIPVETTVNLWDARDNGEILNTGRIILEVLRDTDDGIFETVGHWHNFCSEIELSGAYFLAKWLSSGNPPSVDDTVIYKFETPIKVLTGYQVMNGVKTDIISEVTEIKFKIDFNFFWRNRETFASSIEVYGTPVEMK